MSIAHSGTRFRVVVALGLVLPLVRVTVANAQSAGGMTGGTTSGGATPAGGAAAPAGSAGGAVQPSVTTQYFPGGVAPPPPGGTLGGGNAQYSSSKPIVGNEQDTFDFKNGGSAGTVHGTEGSSFVLGGAAGGGVSGVAGPVPNVHNVRKGDTLWDIGDHYFRNPYQWPRIWSYNPQIQNPHWIFPGDQVRLRSSSSSAADAQQAAGSGASSKVIDKRRQVPPDTIFLRTQGYIDDDTNNWGEISGSPEEKMILTDFDDVYLRVSSNHDLKVGQELTVFRPVRNVAGGKLIEIQGTVKVDQWNAKDRIARGKITEALDTIERGARVAPVTRRFEVVQPTRNDKDVTAKILTSVQPHGLFGENQIVFVDQGEEAGLKPGNRLFVIRKGDAWHATQTTDSSAKRIALEDESPAATEDVPKPRDPSRLPEDVLAELRVITARKGTAMCIITSSRHEIEAGDMAFARKGY